MEPKTKILAEDGKQELMITREFDLPVELLFKAYAEPELVEQWMGTKVLKLENKSMAVISLKQPTLKETSMASMVQSMSLARTGKSRGHLKWRIHLLVCSWSFLNLKVLLTIPANSQCM
jgi:hypothetical protein